MWKHNCAHQPWPYYEKYFDFCCTLKCKKWFRFHLAMKNWSLQRCLSCRGFTFSEGKKQACVILLVKFSAKYDPVWDEKRFSSMDPQPCIAWLFPREKKKDLKEKLESVKFCSGYSVQQPCLIKSTFRKSFELFVDFYFTSSKRTWKSIYYTASRCVWWLDS